MSGKRPARAAARKPAVPDTALMRLQAYLRGLYEANNERGYRFRYGLLAFDIATVAFIVGTSFLPRHAAVATIDVLLGIFILCDFLARLTISRQRMRDAFRVSTWADIVAIASFLAPLAGEGAAFLRILRTLRLLRTYSMLARLRHDSTLFRRNEEVIVAVTNLSVFLYVMTAVIYETQHYTNPLIANYADALYFTVTSLTTTGYGDIVLSGTTGRLLSVVVMIFGVTLFFRLARALLQPYKVRFRCPDCGLLRHDIDAVHCKACGRVLNIPDEGQD